VTSHDDLIVRVLGFEGLNRLCHVRNDRLLSSIKSLVHLAAGAARVVSQYGVEVVDPVTDGGGATVNYINSILLGHVSDISLPLKNNKNQNLILSSSKKNKLSKCTVPGHRYLRHQLRNLQQSQ
jgi:hypothetical protein